MEENTSPNEKGLIKNEKVRKVLRIAGDVLLGIVIVLAAFVLFVTITAKKDENKTPTVFGYQFLFVKTQSMEKCDAVDVSGYKIKSIPAGSCVFVSTVPEDDDELKEWYKTVKVGDVLTFQYSETGNSIDAKSITHRVVKIEPKGEGFLIFLQGDNRESPDGVLTQVIDTNLDRGRTMNYIVGRVTGQSRFLGALVAAFGKPVGIILLIIVPCMIIIAFQVMRIVKVVGEEKKEKASANEIKHQSEIEELKRQIEMLKQTTGAGVAADGSNAADESGGADMTQPETPPSAETNE